MHNNNPKGIVINEKRVEIKKINKKSFYKNGSVNEQRKLAKKY